MLRFAVDLPANHLGFGMEKAGVKSVCGENDVEVELMRVQIGGPQPAVLAAVERQGVTKTDSVPSTVARVRSPMGSRSDLMVVRFAILARPPSFAEPVRGPERWCHASIATR